MNAPTRPAWLLLAALGLATLHVAAAHADDEAKTRTVTFDVVGMVSDACPVLVKQALRRVDGVKRVDASAKTKTVQVEYLPSRTSPKAIQKVIKDKTGFDAKVRRSE